MMKVNCQPAQTPNYPKRRSDVKIRRVEGETVVLDRQGGQIHQLNSTASIIWNLCDGRSTLAEIENQMAEAFDVDRKTAAKDLAAILWQLRQLNLLE
jgi:hypothetical protein